MSKFHYLYNFLLLLSNGKANAAFYKTSTACYKTQAAFYKTQAAFYNNPFFTFSMYMFYAFFMNNIISYLKV